MCRRALTLIEIVITTAIISALLAITLPAIGKASAASRRATCASRIKDLATALGTYAHDFNAFLPPGPRELNSLPPFTKDPDRGNPLELFSSLRIGRPDFSSQNGWYGQGLLWQRAYIVQPGAFYCPEMRHRGWGLAQAWPRHFDVAPAAAGEKSSVMGSYLYRGGYASAQDAPDGPLNLYRNAAAEPVLADSPLFGSMIHSSGYTVGFLGGYAEFHAFPQPPVPGTFVAPLWTALSPTPPASPTP